MPKIKVFPHRELCPKGAEIEAEKGQSLCEALLDHKVKIEHACELSCACTTCHVIVRKGFNDLNESSDDEEDMLDLAPGLEPQSRLACQCVPDGSEDVVVEIPEWNRNLVSETH